jgi:hypothetical protein
MNLARSSTWSPSCRGVSLSAFAKRLLPPHQAQALLSNVPVTHSRGPSARAQQHHPSRRIRVRSARDGHGAETKVRKPAQSHHVHGGAIQGTAVRCKCMGAFPATQVFSMRLNDLLNMYVCAYQNSFMWKDIWKFSSLVPLLLRQVIRDVEAFTHREV